MSNGTQISIKCPRCEREVMGVRHSYDPPEAATCLTLCPECCGGDFSEVSYEDARGVELVSDDGYVWRAIDAAPAATESEEVRRG